MSSDVNPVISSNVRGDASIYSGASSWRVKKRFNATSVKFSMGEIDAFAGDVIDKNVVDEESRCLLLPTKSDVRD